MKELYPPSPLIIRFTRWNYLFIEWIFAILRETSEGTTRWFDWSFAPILRSRDRFARQNRCELPPWFLVASLCPSIDHHLSGRVLRANGWQIKCKLPPEVAGTCTYTITSTSYQLLNSRIFAFTAPVHLVTMDWLARNNTLLGPCFKTGRNGHYRCYPYRSLAEYIRNGDY